MPLATKLRPTSLTEFIGQQRLVGSKGPLRKIIETKNIPSMIFWGPPASGKTTLATIISKEVEADFITLSAVNTGKADLRKVILRAAENKNHGLKTILFIDEIHRWNKAQQDALLPYVENGDITLIGATTENPSFTVINALLSRSRVFVFDSHEASDVRLALEKGVKELKTKVDPDALDFLADASNGDIRFALNSLEIAASLSGKKKVTKELIENAIQKSIRYDRDGEEHYNVISAVHKSLRSSNATAAVYWITRMLQGGEDPLYIARRLIRFASEDIGNVNPNALLLANMVYDTCHKIGMPECDVALVQLAQYLADSKKDNSAYIASSKAKEDVKRFGELPVPMHFRNAPTQLMKDLDYGKGYQYDHDLESKKSDQQAMPEELRDRNYFN
jgi:putative ATPase